MKSMPWYKWEPGSIPYLDRICLEARGVLWMWMDDHWRGFPIQEPDEEVSDLVLAQAKKVWPVLKANLDAFKSEAEEKAKSRHISSENANRIRWGSKSDPKPSQEVDTEAEPEEEKIKKEPKRSRVTKAKEPAPKETLAAILEDIQTLIGDYEATGVYWALMGFWDKDKNQAPTQTAKALRDALKAGATIDEIFDGAKQFRASVDDPKFMTRPLAWLQNEGWMTYAANQ